MNDIADRLYISTVADDAAEIAREYGLGLEITEFCTAMNMDTNFEYWDAKVRRETSGTPRLTFHAPFNELCPAAIDPLVTEVTGRRYEQAYKLMRGYGINTMIVHSGFLPVIYHREWFTEKSRAFWRGFLSDKPGDFRLYLENTFEGSPELLPEIIESVDDARFRLCLDVGHAAASGSAYPIGEWIRQSAPYLAHVHLHNNYGARDTHNALGDGSVDMAALIRAVTQAAPGATFTVESARCESSVEWLKTNGFLTQQAEAL